MINIQLIIPFLPQAPYHVEALILFASKSFRLMVSVTLPAVRWKVIPSSSRNSACFILPVGLGFGCSFFFKTKLNSSYLDRLQGIEFVLDQLRYREITSLAQSVRPYS